MARLGGFGKFPMRLGGAPSPQAKAFASLRSLEGEGLGALDDEFGDRTIDGAWHQALASGLGSLTTFGEAAVWQGFPSTVSDLIPEYERILNITPPIGASEEARRQVIMPKWIGNIESAYPGLSATLTALDLRFSIKNPNHDAARVSNFGKVLDPQVATASHEASMFPAYSDDYAVNILLDVGQGVPANGSVGILRAQGEQTASEAIPAWCDYNIFLAVGFILDTSLLDVTALT